MAGSSLWVVRLASLLAVGFVVGSVEASPGDAHPLYRVKGIILFRSCFVTFLCSERTCVKECKNTGVIGSNIISHCQSQENDSTSAGSSWYTQEPLYMQWKHQSCMSDCRYYCMIRREEERQLGGLSPVKYHGKWPFKRVSVFQACFGLLPLRPQTKRTYYEYTGLWHIYAILSLNAWFWSTIFHTRDIDLTEKLDYSSAVAQLGYSLILTLLRTFNVKDEAGRVMFAAPILAFVTTHILYLNFYELDYGWNMKVCVAMGVVHIVAWTTWAVVTHHPSRFKVWIVIFGGALAMLLEVYDFPPYKGYADAHSLWHASTIPLTYLWWTFVRDDAEFRTSTLVKKAK
uniref:Post-GPI attachment to proteins factor 3 n=1 Tax=Aegilops tauschii TaxID=37682 RepID=M8BYQ8_AEGTA